MVPENDPVNPAVDVTLPLNIAGPIFVKVDEPDTTSDPVICTCDPDANIRLLLLLISVPLPTTKAYGSSTILL